MPRDREFYLWDIANAIGDIQHFTKGLAFEQFANDSLVSAAVERKFEIIGEALKQMESLFPGATASLSPRSNS